MDFCQKLARLRRKLLNPPNQVCVKRLAAARTVNEVLKVRAETLRHAIIREPLQAVNIASQVLEDDRGLLAPPPGLFRQKNLPLLDLRESGIQEVRLTDRRPSRLASRVRFLDNPGDPFLSLFVHPPSAEVSNHDSVSSSWLSATMCFARNQVLFVRFAGAGQIHLSRGGIPASIHASSSRRRHCVRRPECIGAGIKPAACCRQTCDTDHPNSSAVRFASSSSGDSAGPLATHSIVPIPVMRSPLRYSASAMFRVSKYHPLPNQPLFAQ
ncbi:MAG: hypothetical protein ABSA67_11385 [Candidatus Brocadiia bacterium]